MALVGSEKSYTKLFFAISQVFMLLALYSIFDEAVVRRPWKGYQEEFNRLERQVAEQGLSQAEADFKSSGSDKKVKDLQLALEQATIAKESDEYVKLTKEFKAKRITLDDKVLKVKFNKSILDNYYYEYKHAFQHGMPYEEEKKRYEDLDADIKAHTLENTAEQKNLDDFNAKIKSYDDKVADLQKQIEDLQKPIVDAQKKIENIDFRPVEVNQVVISDYGVEGNIYWGRVDRCMTCHVAVNKPGYEDVTQAFNLQVVKDQQAVEDAIKKDPSLKGKVVAESQKNYLQVMYGSHPRRQELLGKHPVENFGCTACHGGDGRALRIQGEAFGEGDKAHAFHHHGIEPLLRGPQMESNCLSCHSGRINLSGAQNLSKGAQLFVEMGCQGCHLVKGYDGLHKIGPELNKVANKVDRTWLVDWIRNPHNYMPNTRMPNFGFSDDDAVAIASFLVSQSDPHQLANQISLTGDAANGAKIFDTVGCRGCHTAEMTDKAMESRGRGPNLSRIAAKIKSPTWIYDWIKNPKNYSEHARMPSLRLTDSEAADITAFLMTKSPEYKDEIVKRSGALAAQINPQDQVLIAHGQKLMGERGCYACHLIKGYEAFERIGPELTAEANKENFEFDFGDAALKKDLIFTDVEGKKVFVDHQEEEAGELAAHIAGKVKVPENLKADQVTNLTENWQSWVRNKLKYPLSIYKHERALLKMPQFDLRDNELDALLVFLKGLRNHTIPDRYNADLRPKVADVIAGERVVEAYNCLGCHAIQDFGGEINEFIENNYQSAASKQRYYPPELTHVGEKIRPEWLYQFLSSPWKYRPAAIVRMPTFGFTGDQINTLSYYFTGLSKSTPGLTTLDYHFDGDKLKTGFTLTGKDIYNCFSCHLLNGATPGDDPAVYAPDFATMKPRLQFDFIPKWVQNPVGYQKFAVMPAFLKSKDEAFPDFYEGDPQKQLEALKDYILSVGSDEVIRKEDKHLGSQDQ